MCLNERDKLITNNINLVHWVMHRFFPDKVGSEDFFQEGCLALIKAADAYMTARRTKFSTWAITVIRNHLLDIRAYETLCGRIDAQTLDEDYDLVVGTENQYTDYVFKDYIMSFEEQDRFLIQNLLEGHSYLDISKLFGVTRQTITNRVARLRERLLNEAI
jgi:RNA polymerase sigma factor (sigma-70 family)